LSRAGVGGFAYPTPGGNGLSSAPGGTATGGAGGTNSGGGGGAAGNFQSVGGLGGSGVVILKLNY
jgi:hypothetical protein